MDILASLKQLLATILALLSLVFFNPPPETPQIAPETATTTIATSSPHTNVPERKTAEIERIDPVYEPTPPDPVPYAPLIVPDPAPVTVPTPVTNTPSPQSPSVQSEPSPVQLPQPSMAEIQIISPVPSKGLGRQYSTIENDFDERGELKNEITIGAIVLNDAGEPVKDAVVTITASDMMQNKTLNGTGNVHSFYENGGKVEKPYYPYTYTFKTTGEHTITFSANGQTASVTVTVQ